MFRAAQIEAHILSSETTDVDGLVYWTLPVVVVTDDLGRVEGTIRVLHDLNGTANSWEAARRDAFIAQAPTIHESFTNWSPGDVYQQAIRRG